MTNDDELVAAAVVRAELILDEIGADLGMVAHRTAAARHALVVLALQDDRTVEGIIQLVRMARASEARACTHI